MNQLVTPFSKFQLSQSDLVAGTILSIPQQLVIQNQIAEISESILGLVVDLRAPEVFALEHASLTGMREALQALIEASNEMQNQVAQTTNESEN
jgi:hypothetical protein